MEYICVIIAPDKNTGKVVVVANEDTVLLVIFFFYYLEKKEKKKKKTTHCLISDIHMGGFMLHLNINYVNIFGGLYQTKNNVRNQGSVKKVSESREL